VNETAYGLFYVGQHNISIDVGFYSGRWELSIGSSRGHSATTIDNPSDMAGNKTITLICSQQHPTGYTASIQGPRGVIQLCDLVWIVDRSDILDLYYWQAWAVLNGAYHCCFSIPGKVSLLQPQ
jgi:hypothetical protein